MKSVHIIPRHLNLTYTTTAFDSHTVGFAAHSLIRFPFGTATTRLKPRLAFNKSSLLDFQDYTKPTRLLPATQPELFVDQSLENIISTLQSDGSLSLYKILLHTSSAYDSGLTDLNAGLLICIVDENGDSVLQRIPAILSRDHIVHFQRGSTDDFVFWGPKLGRIQALWISLESGKWRLGGVNLTIINNCCELAEEANEEGSPFSSISYDFEVEDVLLGEGGDMTMIELLPSLVKEYSGADSFSFEDANIKQAESLAEKGITNEASMREYVDLKYSLLLYDAVLIFGGTSISSLTAGENTTLAFLTGGIGGFLYLLLLQRSVDELPAPETVLVDKGSDLNRLFGGLKGQLLVLAFAFGVAILVTRHELLDSEAALMPSDILFGMIGFLACKVSVVLAAFKPISMGHGRE